MAEHAVAHLEIIAPRGEADLSAVRQLFLEYSGSLGFSLDYQDFAAELAELPGEYQPPTGALRLALADGAAAGTAALRPLGPGICEMKRLYVRPAYRGLRSGEGLSLGRALAAAIIADARVLGYGRLRLDTVAGKMDAAIKLYRSLGFSDIPPYYPSPIAGTVYLELVL